ncbi:MAG: fumarate hydratase C-terminal domain-containing protein [Candidatus Ratteibacteria bacterium]|jgi:fumarate hydratase subunit beta
MKKVELPFKKEVLRNLRAGDEVLLFGVIFTARDQVHKILYHDILAAEKKKRPPVFPFPIAGQTFYYSGPTPPPPGRVIGSAGPTTSSRMDRYTPLLLEYGLKGMVGKGERSAEVRLAVKKYSAVYFVTYGGCGALLASHVTEAKIAAFPELGPEAVWRLVIRDFPAVVAIDSRGKVFP